MQIHPKDEIELIEYRKIMTANAFKNAEDFTRRWCHKYIFLRDLIVNDSGAKYIICICCGKKIDIATYSDGSVMNGKKLHASHYYNDDKFASLRYHEDNLNMSCERCNRLLHGNKEKYQVNLIKKIGQERFDKLVRLHNQVKKWNILELNTLKEDYKQKAKELAKQKGIKI